MSFLFVPITTVTKTFTIRAHADYREPEPGKGGVLGNGTVHWDDKTALFVFEGDVTAPGVLEGSGVSKVLGVKTARATLNQAGTELTLEAFGETVYLRKADCPNTPPVATILSPAPGATPTRVTVQQPLRLEGAASDAEDSTIPWTRYVWTSDREGVIGRGPSIEPPLPQYGHHTITLTVTDHGGLTGTATTEVEVINRPPQPTIVRPLADSRHYVGAPVLFRGVARDLDVGYLRGDSLEWSALSLGRIGSGQAFTRMMPEGEHLIVLLVRDGSISRTASVRISVHRPPPDPQPGVPSRPFTFPPTVQITMPLDQSDVLVERGGCVTLRATATDVEDGTGPFHRMAENAVRWEQTVGVLGPAETTRFLGKGERFDFCRPSLGAHDVTARVVDSDGATASDTIRFTVQRMP